MWQQSNYWISTDCVAVCDTTIIGVHRDDVLKIVEQVIELLLWHICS